MSGIVLLVIVNKLHSFLQSVSRTNESFSFYTLHLLCQTKMESMAVRREARRKRILANSQNRLQFISGKLNTESPEGSPLRKYHLEEDQDRSEARQIEGSTKHTFNNGLIANEPELVRFPQLHSDFVAAGDGELDDWADFAVPTATQADNHKAEPIPLWESLVTYKYDVVILSLIVQLLYNVHFLTFDNTYIFLPLIMYTVTKSIWLPTQNTSTITNALLLLNGVSAGQAQWILGVTKYIGIISQDVFVYLFTMICVQSLCTAIIDTLITQ